MHVGPAAQGTIAGWRQPAIWVQSATVRTIVVRTIAMTDAVTMIGEDEHDRYTPPARAGCTARGDPSFHDNAVDLCGDIDFLYNLPV
jgi:hypothetical protein